MENLRHIAVITPQLEMYGIMLEDAGIPYVKGGKHV